MLRVLSRALALVLFLAPLGAPALAAPAHHKSAQHHAAPKPAPAAVPAAQLDPVPPIAFTHRTLANGLQVFASQDRGTPNVTVQMWYGVGSKDDPAGRSGFAHLFEHMMFKATRDLPAESMDRMTE